MARKILNGIDVSGTMILVRESDPGSPTNGEMWVNGAALKYRDNAGGPATHVVEVQDNKGAANGYAGLNASGEVDSSDIQLEAHGIAASFLLMGG